MQQHKTTALDLNNDAMDVTILYYVLYQILNGFAPNIITSTDFKSQQQLSNKCHEQEGWYIICTNHSFIYFMSKFVDL